MEPLMSETETALDLLLEDRLNRPYKKYIVAIPRLITFLWIRQMVEEADLLFTIPVGILFWVLEEHETIIVALLLIIV